MNLAPGSWTRFTLGLLVAPLALLMPAVVHELLALLNISSHTFGAYTFEQVASGLVRTFLVFWAFLSVMLLIMGLVLRRLRKTATRHHVLAAMVTILLVVCGSSVINALASEPLPGMTPADAVVVENPYCSGWVLYDALRFLAIFLLFTVPALVFKWCAYGKTAAPAGPGPVWRVLGILYAVALPLSALYLILQRHGIVPDTSHLWC